MSAAFLSYRQMPLGEGVRNVVSLDFRNCTGTVEHGTTFRFERTNLFRAARVPFSKTTLKDFIEAALSYLCVGLKRMHYPSRSTHKSTILRCLVFSRFFDIVPPELRDLAYRFWIIDIEAFSLTLRIRSKNFNPLDRG